MSEPATDPLKDLLRRELDKLAADATAQADASVSAERLQTLSSLAKLIETRDSLRPKTRTWWPAVVFLATLVIASVLLFLRVAETEIELDVTLSEISFSAAKAEVLTQAANLNALGVSGLRDITLPGVSDLIPGRHPRVVSFTTAPGGASGITLEPLSLPSRAKVTIAQSEVPNQYRLSVRAKDWPFRATLFGQVTPRLPGVSIKDFNVPVPREVSVRGGSDDVSLSLTFPSLPQSPVSPQLEVSDLAFLRVDQFSDSEQESVRRVSTILGGTLSLESLNSQEIRLRSGEELHFGTSRGEIRSLELEPKHLNVKLRATVSGMSLGTGEAKRSIMPTYLDWIRARHSASLLWGTSLYLFGIVAAGLRWWGLRS